MAGLSICLRVKPFQRFMRIWYVEEMNADGVKVGVIPNRCLGIQPEAELPALLEGIADGLQAGFVETVFDRAVVGVAREVGDRKEERFRTLGFNGRIHGGLVV
jgi:hypothetical protein